MDPYVLCVRMSSLVYETQLYIEYVRVCYYPRIDGPTTP